MLHMIYHYGDEDFNDRGYGCVYRNIQTLLSVFLEQNPHDNRKVPGIVQLLREFKGDDFQQLSVSDRWIEPHAAGQYLQKKWNIGGKDVMSIGIKGDRPCIMSTDVSIYGEHVGSSAIRDERGITLLSSEALNELHTHFRFGGLPVLIDDGVMSYLIMGMDNAVLFIADPHMYTREKRVWTDSEFLQRSWMMFIPSIEN